MESSEKFDGTEIRLSKKERERLPIKFYHASPKRLRHGDILVPGDNHSEVSLTTSPVPHATIAFERILPEPRFRQSMIEQGRWKKEWDGKWYVYEVKPLKSVRYMGEEREARTEKAQIIKFVGDARGILRNQLKKHNSTENDRTPASLVERFNKVRGVKVVGRGPLSFWSDLNHSHLKKTSSEILDALSIGDVKRVRELLMSMPYREKFKGPGNLTMEVVLPTHDEVEVLEKSVQSKNIIASVHISGKAFELIGNRKTIPEALALGFLRKNKLFGKKVVFAETRWENSTLPIPEGQNSLFRKLKKECPDLDYRIVFSSLYAGIRTVKFK